MAERKSEYLANSIGTIRYFSVGEKEKKKKRNKAILDYFIYVQTVALHTKKKEREKQDYPNKGTNKFTFNEDQQKLQK